MTLSPEGWADVCEGEHMGFTGKGWVSTLSRGTGRFRVLAVAVLALAGLGLGGCVTDPDPMQTIRDHNFYAGLAAFNQAHYQEAATYWTKAAEFGDGEAARNLGHLYRQGLGVEPDAAIAVGWYQVAADAGIPSAQYNLGMVYLHGGNNVAKDRLAALYWLSKAAAAGIEPARKELDRLATETRIAAERPGDPPTAVASSPPSAPMVETPVLARAQVGSYRLRQSAEADWKRLRGAGVSPEIIANRDQGQGRWYRLLAVGSPEAVEAYCRQAVENGRECRPDKSRP